METNGQLGRAVAVGALIAGLAASLPAAVIYVDDDAAGTNNGSSWADALRYLRDALATARAGDEIRVAQGIYRPDQGADLRDGGPDLAFLIVHGIVLRGGYAGVGASDPNARDIQLCPTVLSGDCNGNDVELSEPDLLAHLPGRGDNSRHVVVIEHVDFCVLDGFSIRDGHALEGGGGGLLVHSSDVTVWNCTFTRNWGPAGGAVFIPRLLAKNLSDVGMHNCRFMVNAAAQHGGALRAEDGALYLSGNEENGTLLLTDCEFAANTSPRGGAVSGHLVAVTLSGCTFRANSADDGGGLHQARGSLNATGCTFVENSALSPHPASFTRGQGGAVFVDIWSEGRVTLADCMFRNNRAVSGGALLGKPMELRGCRFTGNVGREHAGAVDCSGTLIGRNCLFDGNQSLRGIGAVDSYGAQFTNCTFAGNRSPDGIMFRSLAGHGTVWSNAFTNCIIRGMSHGLDPHQVWLAKTTVTYCNVEGGYPGVGNIDVDPDWAAPGQWRLPRANDPSRDVWIEGDYHLKSEAGRWDPAVRTWVHDEVTSPCIDAGDPTTPVGAEPLPNGGRINLGVYGGTVEASRSYLGQP